MTPADTAVESLPAEPRERVSQAAEQLRRARALQGEARLQALRRALELNPYALKARYWLGVSLLQARQLTPARRALEQVSELSPDHAPLKFYCAVDAILETKKGDLEKAETLLKGLESGSPADLHLALCRLELALRRKKNRPSATEWLAWLERIRVEPRHAPIVADKCAKFFMERDEAAEGDQVLAWLKNTWLAQLPDVPLIAALPHLHHIRYWPRERWLAELQGRVLSEAASDLACLFILERTKKDDQGCDVPDDKRRQDLRDLVERLPGVTSLAYHYLALLNNAAKKCLLAEGNAAEALRLWRECVRLDPFNTLIQFNMALAEAQQGNTRDYYIHWQQALRLAYWRWDLTGDRQDLELCIVRTQATASKLRQEIESRDLEHQAASPAKILAWLNYVDLYALLRQLAFEHPCHQLGVGADAPANATAEVQRAEQFWQTALAGWELQRNGTAHAPRELIQAAKSRLRAERAARAKPQPPHEAERASFQDYCRQRAAHLREAFSLAHWLAGVNRFEEARLMLKRLATWPLATLEPYLAEIKVNADEGEVPLSKLINQKGLAERLMGYTARYGEFLAEEGDDQELARQLAQLGALPWSLLDKPDEARRKTRERMAFAALEPALGEAIKDKHWDQVIPAVEAALRRLPDQIDLLGLAVWALLHSVGDAFSSDDADRVQWKDVRARLQKAADYCKRASQVEPAEEVLACLGNMPDVVLNQFKVATEMDSPSGKAVRRARALMKQEQWNQAYQALNQVSARDRSAQAEFYLGLCIYREFEATLESGKQRMPLSDLQARLEKAAAHVQSASQKSPDPELREGIDNLGKAINGWLAQVKRAQVMEAARALMDSERWDEAYKKLSALADPDAVALFYMAVCRFRRVEQEFAHASQYNLPSIPHSISWLDEALRHIRDARKASPDDDLKETLDKLESAVRQDLNILRTM